MFADRCAATATSGGGQGRPPQCPALAVFQWGGPLCPPMASRGAQGCPPHCRTVGFFQWGGPPCPPIESPEAALVAERSVNMRSDIFSVSNAAPAISPTLTTASVLRTSIGCEWRLVRSDLGWWAAVFALIGCVGYSLESGRARIADRTRSVVEAQRDEVQRVATLTKLLGRIERNEVKPPDAPYRDPRNAIYVGRGQGATVAYLADAPLAIAAIGLSDLYPQVLRVSASSKDSFLFVERNRQSGALAWRELRPGLRGGLCLSALVAGALL